MKIAVVVSTFPPYKGGTGNVAAQHAKALQAAGHQVTVFSPGETLKPLIRFGNAAWVPQLLWRLRGQDVVELHYPFFGGAEAVWMWKMLFGRNSRLCTLYHMDTVGTGWMARFFRTYRKLVLPFIVSASDKILVTSRDYATSSHLARWSSDAKVLEIPLTIDGDRFVPGHTAKSPNILFVGGLDRAHYFKGITTLLKAFAQLPAKHATSKLIIVGDGDLRESYENEALKLGIADRVEFLGKVSDQDLPGVYQNALVHVLPSHDRSEAFGLVTLEAAASGIPSIVSDLPGVRSVIEPGITGLVVPPGDPGALAKALELVLDDQDLAVKMGQEARNRFERTYAQTIVDRLLASHFSS